MIPNSFVHKRLKRNKRESKQPLKACFIGQIEEIKGIYLLFKLLEKLNSSIMSRLVVCGTGSKVNEVREFSKKDNRLEYKGHLPIENLQEIIAQSDILLVPSVWEEPFGRVIIESYNQGTPVIAANVGGISDIVYSKKWLFNKNDIDDFVSKVYHFYSLTNVEIKREIELSYKTSNFYRENITQHIKMYDKLVNKI
ncbi:glycosyltransferase [Heyndrickxia coagulans]|uniref:glycosyltransferase n=1 Tax=Heyndrickxia coagulans TaxID=1398 RepID=UPI003D1FF104